MEQAVTLEPGQGRSVSLRGTQVRFTVESTYAKGASCTEWEAAPGFDTGLHVHERLEETWYVLDGAVEFQLGRRRSPRPPVRPSSCRRGSRTRSPTAPKLPPDSS